MPPPIKNGAGLPVDRRRMTAGADTSRPDLEGVEVGVLELEVEIDRLPLESIRP